jgi:hypothetical protein
MTSERALRESAFCYKDFTRYLLLQALRIILAEQVIRTMASDGKMSSDNPKPLKEI